MSCSPCAVRRLHGQPANGPAGAFAGAQFERFSKQHEHRRSLEKDVHFAVSRERRRNDAGKQHRHGAEEIGRANSHGDQGEHVHVPAAVVLLAR